MAHEELKKQWEKDVEQYGENAHEMWEFSCGRDHWITCKFGGPLWYNHTKYRRKKPPFQPEYFSGLNWRDALPLVGKLVEYSNDPDDDGWQKGTLDDVDNDSGRRFSCDGTYWEYIRTTPETNAHPTVTLTVNGKEWVLPRPEVGAPKHGKVVWIITPFCPDGYFESEWAGYGSEQVALKKGYIHLTKDRAKAWADFWKNGIMAEIKK